MNPNITSLKSFKMTCSFLQYSQINYLWKSALQGSKFHIVPSSLTNQSQGFKTSISNENRTECSPIWSVIVRVIIKTGRPGGGTPPFGLYGYVPLDRVWYYEPRDFNPDCEQSLSFLSLRPGACEKFLLLICITSTE